MDINEMLGKLMSNGFVLLGVKHIQHGVQFVFLNGALISVYHTGKINVQGKHMERAKELLGLSAPRFKWTANTIQQATDCVAVHENALTANFMKMLICHEQRDITAPLKNLPSRRIENDHH